MGLEQFKQKNYEFLEQFLKNAKDNDCEMSLALMTTVAAFLSHFRDNIQKEIKDNMTITGEQNIKAQILALNKLASEFQAIETLNREIAEKTE